MSDSDEQQPPTQVSSATDSDGYTSAQQPNDQTTSGDNTSSTDYTSSEDQRANRSESLPRTASDENLTTPSHPTDYSSSSPDEAPPQPNAEGGPDEVFVTSRNEAVRRRLPINTSNVRIPPRKRRPLHPENNTNERNRPPWYTRLCNYILCLTVIVLVCIAAMMFTENLSQSILLFIMILYSHFICQFIHFAKIVLLS